MTATVTLEVTSGPLTGQRFDFAEPDFLVIGKEADCRVQLPAQDALASRHHFVLEVRPPRVRARDLGSLNGTFVNEEKIGSRHPAETPEQGQTHTYPNVELADHDQIRASQTSFAVSMQAAVYCVQCGRETDLAPDTPDPRCPQCRAGAAAAAQPHPVDRPAAPDAPDAPDAPAAPAAPVERSGAELSDPAAVLIRLLLEHRGVPQRAGVREIAGYQIGRLLGRGGMGAVYLAHRQSDGAEVALKVMLAEAPAGSLGRRTFGREIQMQQRLGSHPNCVPVLDYDLEGTGAYFVMDYCPGGSVDTLMLRRGGKLSVSEAAPLMLQCLTGLQHAHEHHVIHRDLKPQNVLLTSVDGGTARLTDFGLAKDFELAGMSGMTRTGSTGGTPVFLPREQVTNFKYMKPDTDVGGMAGTFYNMLTGAFWRDFAQYRDPINIILNEPVIPIRDRDRSIPRRLAAVIDRAASDDTRQRYQSAAEFRAALLEAL
jgi:hypothetical protein